MNKQPYNESIETHPRFDLSGFIDDYAQVFGNDAIQNLTPDKCSLDAQLLCKTIMGCTEALRVTILEAADRITKARKP